MGTILQSFSYFNYFCTWLTIINNALLLIRLVPRLILYIYRSDSFRGTGSYTNQRKVNNLLLKAEPVEDCERLLKTRKLQSTRRKFNIGTNTIGAVKKH